MAAGLNTTVNTIKHLILAVLKLNQTHKQTLLCHVNHHSGLRMQLKCNHITLLRYYVTPRSSA